MDNKKYQYVYEGDVEVHVQGLGVIKPGQEVESDFEINNPLFKNKEVKAKK
jgi:hypothetical protein